MPTSVRLFTAKTVNNSKICSARDWMVGHLNILGGDYIVTAMTSTEIILKNHRRCPCYSQAANSDFCDTFEKTLTKCVETFDPELSVIILKCSHRKQGGCEIEIFHKD